MKEFLGGDVLGGVDHLIEVGQLKIDNPVVEVIVATAAVAGLLYAGYKILNEKGAAENVATAFGKKSDKEG